MGAVAAQGAFDGPYAMAIERRALVGADGQVVVALILVGHRPAGEEGDLLVEHPPVAGDGDIAAGDEGQPQEVVAEMRAHALVGGRMPPVLYVAVDELVGGGPQ